MKAPKKKAPRVRRRWQINPLTRVKASDKLYSRRQAKQQAHQELQDES